MYVCMFVLLCVCGCEVVCVCVYFCEYECAPVRQKSKCKLKISDCQLSTKIFNRKYPEVIFVENLSTISLVKHENNNKISTVVIKCITKTTKCLQMAGIFLKRNKNKSKIRHLKKKQLPNDLQILSGCSCSSKF